MAQRRKQIDNLETSPKVVSTVYTVGQWLMPNGTGALVAATPGKPVVGVCLEPVNTNTSTYADATYQLHYDGIDKDTDRFLMPVSVGTAIASMIGSPFNVSSSDASSLDVTSYQTMKYDTLAVSTFAVGHTITGGTSSATAVILDLVGSTGLIVGTVTGTFLAGEVITDGTSSATARLRTDTLGGTQFEITQVLSTTLVEVKVLAIG